MIQPQQQAQSDLNRDLLIAGLAGLAAAIAAGIAWGLVVKWTNREWGIAAWAVGGAVGASVAAAARGRRGTPFQVVSVVCAVIGVLLGKYLEVAWADADIELGVFSSDTWNIFTDSGSGIWSWYDAIWFAAAVFTAYRIPGLRPQVATPLPAPAGAQPPPADDQNRN